MSSLSFETYSFLKNYLGSKTKIKFNIFTQNALKINGIITKIIMSSNSGFPATLI